MAINGAGQGPVAPHRTHGRIIAIVAVAVSIGLALLAIVGFIGYRLLVGGAKAAVDGLMQGISEYGAQNASAAAALAQRDHTALGALTIQQLDAAYPKVRWLPATQPSTNATWPPVSILMSATHLITAGEVIQGICSYGLVVESTNDPIIGSDGLPGTGTYATVFVEQDQHASICEAVNAPTTGWVKTNPPRH